MKFNQIIYFTILMSFIFESTSAYSCTVIIPSLYTLNVTEEQITNAATGTNIITSPSQNILVTDCVQNTTIAVQSNNVTVHPFAIDSTLDIATDVDSISARFTISSTPILINNQTNLTEATNSNGDLTLPISTSLWKTSQPYNDEDSLNSSIDLQLLEL